MRLSELSPKAFINAVHSGDWLSRSREFIEKMVQEDQKWESKYGPEQDITGSM